MSNGSERSIMRDAAREFVREMMRVATAFTCLFLSYLLSGIPYGVEASSTYQATAHAVEHLGSSSAASSAMAHRNAASRVVADSFWSQVLGIRKQFVVYLPPSYEANAARRFPVAYYLHGLDGNEWNWVRVGGIDRTLDSLIARGMPEMIVVMPDGDDSWYTTWNNLGNNVDCRRSTPRGNESVDAYCVPWPKYDDYITRDLVARVDSVYRTIPSRTARAIAGLSMGGYGAISLALAYPDVFSAAASHSGVLSPLFTGPHPYAAPPRYAANEMELRASSRTLWPSQLLAFGRDTTGWWPRDPGRRAARTLATDRTRMPALMVDVGVDDVYADQSRDFHATLQRLGVPHEYKEWPGAHNWAYWRAHSVESLQWIGARIGRSSTAGGAR